MKIVPGVYTFSVLYENGTLDTITGTVPEASFFDRNMNGQNVQFGVSGTNNFILVNYSNKNVSLKAVKFECGDQQTLAHQEGGKWVLNEIPNFAEELAKCQRYLYVTRPQNENNYNSVGFGVCSSATAAWINVPLPVTMSKRPAVSYTGNIVVTNNGFFASGKKVTGMTTLDYSNHGVVLTITTDTGLEAGRYAECVAANNNEAKVILDANL